MRQFPLEGGAPRRAAPHFAKNSTENSLYTLEIPFLVLFVICFVDLCLHGMYILVVDDDMSENECFFSSKQPVELVEPLLNSEK
jgi:hypothetical protein